MSEWQQYKRKGLSEMRPYVKGEDLSEIIEDFPPNIDEIREYLPVGVNNIFAYDGKIYSPGNPRLPPELVAHERVHFHQQGDDPDGWWFKFLRDPVFRMRQEIPAHQVEWRIFLETGHRSRNERRLRLRIMAKRLSAPMYGCMMTFTKAKSVIRDGKEYEELTV